MASLSNLCRYRNNLEGVRGPFLLPFSGRDSESKRGESSRGGESEAVLWRLRGDRSYEITAAAEQTSFAEFGQDFNRSDATAYGSLWRRLKVTAAAASLLAKSYLMAAGLAGCKRVDPLRSTPSGRERVNT